ncbi:hypothetical protein NEAUS04_0709 [Nematocida ausubeli]|nr:hypothetical protein NEAUS07_0904 [Nematocida ausubeli]KAI5147739.1 hypothetical protein NEAUS05_1026 [Nematocida ausubeli]KAI5161789.1 hypothetical protein NEAUS04_0709 [Nematocida ausubeli]
MMNASKNNRDSIQMASIENIEEASEARDNFPAFPTIKYVTLTFKKDKLKNDTMRLYEKIRPYNQASGLTYTKFYGQLHTMILNNLEVAFDPAVDPSHRELLENIIRATLEKKIIENNLASGLNLYALEKVPMTNQDYISVFKDAIKELEPSRLIIDVMQFFNLYYQNITQLTHINQRNYLRHMHMTNIHAAMYTPCVYLKKKSDLEEFCMKVHSYERPKKKYKPHPKSFLFKKRENGEYNIDYALNLLFNNKNEIGNYYSGHPVYHPFTLSDEDKKLLVTLFQNWSMVERFFRDLYELLDKKSSKKTMNERFLVGKVFSTGHIARPSDFNPHVYYQSVEQMLGNTLKEMKHTTKEEAAYIKDMVQGFNNLIMDTPVLMRNKTAVTKRSTSSRFSRIFGFLGGIGTIVTLGTLATFSMYENN